MSKVLFLLLAMGLNIHTAALGQSGPRNLDFENGEVGRTPPGWFVPTSGYAGTLVQTSPKQGKMCVHLRAYGSGEKAPFGNIMQSFGAGAYRGKVVRLRAAIRTELAGSAQGQAQMWLRIDRSGGSMGFFDNMGDRPIREQQWGYYEIVGQVHDDAEHVNFGLMIIGEAQAWFDDVTFEVVGKAERLKTEPPRPLEGRALENLVAFTRLLGYVRYFHPSDEAAETNWAEFASAGVRAVEPAKSPGELAGVLQELFNPVAPTVRVYETGKAPSAPGQSPPPGNTENLRVTAWKHRGLGSTGAAPYLSERISKNVQTGQVPDDMPNPAEPFAADLGGGVSCLVPLVVYADPNGTIPKGTAEEGATGESIPKQHTGDDRATRLADVALCWNVMQHFYPYFDVVDADWPAALTRALKAAAQDKDERDFLDTLRRLIAALRDGHGYVLHGSDNAYSTLPLIWDWIEGRLVITHVAEEASGETDTGGLRSGDIVHQIDGRSSEQALISTEKLVSAATPQFRRYKALQQLASGREGEEVALVVENSSGRKRTVTLRRSVPKKELKEPRPFTIEEIKPGIIYLDFNRITNQEFTEALSRLKRAKGIVFDFRGYPSGIRPDAYFPHIIDRPVDSPQWHIPVLRRPDRQDVEFVRGGEWHLSPSEPYLGAKKAFIVDGRCISYAESCLGIIEHYRLGEIVGQPTAGTNGNVNSITLPGGYHVSWTGMKVLKQDGSQHHGIGIQPTVPVSRTIKGIAEGRDELLDKALEVVGGT